MGLFDTYGNIQLKVGDLNCNHFKVGQKVNIPDGVYVAPEGVVVIQEGKLKAAIETDHVTSKWGDEIGLDVILAPHDYISQTIASIQKPDFDEHH
jgi:hypothetical protein